MTTTGEQRIVACRDCKWAVKPGLTDFIVGSKDWKCAHEKSKWHSTDPVTGISQSYPVYCDLNRSSDGFCGFEGRLWEARNA